MNRKHWSTEVAEGIVVYASVFAAVTALSLFSGCGSVAPVPKNPEQALTLACSDAGYQAVNSACVTLIMATSKDQKAQGAIYDACLSWVNVQEAICSPR